MAWRTIYRTRYLLSKWRFKFAPQAVLFSLILALSLSALFIPQLDLVFDKLVVENRATDTFKGALLSLGGALFGASAIVSSLVLFAMQVNIERMPHGLFRRFSADVPLLSLFAATFLFSLLVFALPLMLLPHRGGLAVYLSSWATMLTLLFFFVAYRRALNLVNPTFQLETIVKRCRLDLKRWAKRAERARPLIAHTEPDPVFPGDKNERGHDLQKAVYYSLNPHWTAEARKGVDYAVSYVRLYAKQGDYEVCRIALNAIGNIVKDYVNAKEGTFFSQTLFVENPLVTDGFINDTLEDLRQLQAFAIGQKDEQLTEQSMTLFSALVSILSIIEYGRSSMSKTHAHLAASYLTGGVEKAAANQQADVLMHGLRKIGESAQVLLAREGPKGTVSLIGKLATISAVGLVRRDLNPVTVTGVQQLADLSFGLLISADRETRFAIKELRSYQKMLMELVLKTEDFGFMGNHNSLLGPIYSATSSGSLLSKIQQLAQSIFEAPEDQENLTRLISNIVTWSDQMYLLDREIFELTLERQSKFISDHIHWIINVSKSLLMVAAAPACSPHQSDKLRKNALWLAWTIDFVPSEKEKVSMLENYNITDDIFDLSRVARQLGFPEFVAEIDRLLLSWGLKAGNYQSGWQTLENAICGLAISKLKADGLMYDFLTDLRNEILKGALASDDARSDSARELRERAQNLWRNHSTSKIEYAMRQTDEADLTALLEEAADILDGV